MLSQKLFPLFEQRMIKNCRVYCIILVAYVSMLIFEVMGHVISTCLFT